MMRISKIEKHKKGKDNYDVITEDGESFVLNQETVFNFGLRVGDDLREEKISEIKKEDEFISGKKLAFSFLSYKQRSTKDISRKLKQKKISDNTINKVIDYLEEKKYLDDSDYAKTFLKDKLKSKPIGRRLAAQKLFEKGIPKELTGKVISENYTESKELELAAELLKKYRKKIKGKDNFEKQIKIYRYLMSRGFDYETSRKALGIAEE